MSLVSHLDAECLKAVELARLALVPGQKLGVAELIDAVFHANLLAEGGELATLASYFPAPQRIHETPPPAPVDEHLKKVLTGLRDRGPVTPLQLFAALVATPTGQELLEGRGAPLDALGRLVLPGLLPPAPTFLDVTDVTQAVPTVTVPELPVADEALARHQRRQTVLAELAEFGTLLTEAPEAGGPQPSEKLVSEPVLHAVLQYLYTPRSRNLLLVAPPGSGKTSLLRALARKIVERDPSLPAPIAGLDLFELSPMFPRQAEGEAGPFQPGIELQRVWRLLRLLQSAPGVMLCVDRLVSFLNLLYRLSVHQELVDGFRQALDDGSITCIGAAHPQDLDAIAELDRSLLRRFRSLHLPPVTAAQATAILAGRVARLEEYYAPLKVPHDLLPRIVGLADLHLRDRHQPEKSLRLMEAACARAALERPPAPAVTEAHVLQAMEGLVGPVVLPASNLTAEELLAGLKKHIVGQEEGLRELAEAVIAGRSDAGWYMRPGPRGVFLFGGPTGVGKTETATALARILGGGTDALVRVDCQNLQGSGSGWEANTLTWRLLGVAPGYRGHVPGCRDGLLVRVRDYPECVLLFDEFEKADATVGRLILRILDEGKAQDSEGNEIDFRRCLVVLTSNAGVSYTDPERGSILLGRPSGPTEAAVVTEQSLSEGLLATGLGQEFLGRVQHMILFRSLTDGDIGEIIGRQLSQLKDLAVARGKELSWTPAAVDRLASRWRNNPHLGARYLGTLVRLQVLDPLNLAAASGELGDDLHQIVLDAAAAASGGEPARPAASGRVPPSERQREGDRLRIVLR